MGLLYIAMSSLLRGTRNQGRSASARFIVFPLPFIRLMLQHLNGFVGFSEKQFDGIP